MSRIGKKPVQVPSGVTASVSGQTVKVKGPKGELSFTAADDIAVAMENNVVILKTRTDSKASRSKWGMSRTMVANLMEGVTKGYSRELEIQGVGYRAAVQGKNLQLQLGFSHEIMHPIPPGIDIKTPKPTEIVISGIDKRQVGQTAAEIRKYRPPEPFQGKGVRYKGEYVFRKEGKKK
ncbi:MAG TPA: 50S ribosomal protein L6, partial [Alphaproteobacteria bacterium]|nr:50S ribosomal protein L6 [Alphaproteobacteria bacterium]